jgi:hypothetical protein
MIVLFCRPAKFLSIIFEKKAVLSREFVRDPVSSLNKSHCQL